MSQPQRDVRQLITGGGSAKRRSSLAIVAACCGLRVSEFLALKWDDVDWLGRRVRVERAIVMQHLGDCKTMGSQKNLPLADEVLAICRSWREQSAFTDPQHFIFASPVQIGRLPWSYPNVMRVLKAAAKRAGIDRIGTHIFRHSFRSWLDSIRNSYCIAAKADASFGHQNHDERLRRCDARGHAECA